MNYSDTTLYNCKTYFGWDCLQFIKQSRKKYPADKITAGQTVYNLDNKNITEWIKDKDKKLQLFTDERPYNLLQFDSECVYLYLKNNNKYELLEVFKFTKEAN